MNATNVIQLTLEAIITKRSVKLIVIKGAELNVDLSLIRFGFNKPKYSSQCLKIMSTVKEDTA